MWFVGETEMDDLGVVVGLENFERQKESFEAEFVKELDLNEWEPKTVFLNQNLKVWKRHKN